MIYARDYFLFGFLVGWIVSQQKICYLEFDKETLLDFNERLIRDRDGATIRVGD